MAEQIDYMWLSFRDPDKNLNLGCAIIKGNNLGDATQRAWDLKINPGGEVLAYPMTEESVKKEGLEVERLYSREELIKREYKVGIV